ncbi:Methyltransferase domain-containing protein [Oceanobacillus limi]|uniref:Methyltransferase domain-containing protein n=1 Tax=Oceanobacillus limi TaxID=930131 RepID=A0A1I0CH53_9BACI|nr:class I SAM-dependent methyltransferase [Oceanobacillus limi]SET18438.1 Methyltransferase domain-containing protein [Oceanobacillus limi]
MKNQVRAAFNQLANVYENSVDTTSMYNSEYERPAMMAHIPSDLSNKSVLDAGCAAGWYTEQLLQRGANVVATDISPKMIESTRRRVGSTAELICLDLEDNIPFADRTFDFIISSLTLHYLKEWDHTFREFQRILKPGGIILFSIHHPFSDIELLSNGSYFSTDLILDTWNKEGKSYEVPFYRRPLQQILNKTLQYFSIRKVIEPQPTIQFKRNYPDKYEKLQRKPQFLMIKASRD